MTDWTEFPDDAVGKAVKEPYRDFLLRAKRYNSSEPGTRWPGSVFHNTDGRVTTATWFTGQNYRATSDLYGSYPPNYLYRMAPLFDDIPRERVMHLFSGSVKADDGAFTFDRNPAMKPKMVGNAEQLSEHLQAQDGSHHWPPFQLILADPPYSKDDAEKYGYPMVNRRRVVSECAKVLTPGGYLAWLDTVFPMHTKKEFVLVGHIAIIRSTMHRERGVFVFRRV